MKTANLLFFFVGLFLARAACDGTDGTDGTVEAMQQDAIHQEAWPKEEAVEHGTPTMIESKACTTTFTMPTCSCVTRTTQTDGGDFSIIMLSGNEESPGYEIDISNLMSTAVFNPDYSLRSNICTVTTKRRYLPGCPECYDDYVTTDVAEPSHQYSVSVSSSIDVSHTVQSPPWGNSSTESPMKTSLILPSISSDTGHTTTNSSMDEASKTSLILLSISSDAGHTMTSSSKDEASLILLSISSDTANCSKDEAATTSLILSSVSSEAGHTMTNSSKDETSTTLDTSLTLSHKTLVSGSSKYNHKPSASMNASRTGVHSSKDKHWSRSFRIPTITSIPTTVIFSSSSTGKMHSTTEVNLMERSISAPTGAESHNTDLTFVSTSTLCQEDTLYGNHTSGRDVNSSHSTDNGNDYLHSTSQINKASTTSEVHQENPTTENDAWSDFWNDDFWNDYWTDDDWNVGDRNEVIGTIHNPEAHTTDHIHPSNGMPAVTSTVPLHVNEPMNSYMSETKPVSPDHLWENPSSVHLIEKLSSNHNSLYSQTSGSHPHTLVSNSEHSTILPELTATIPPKPQNEPTTKNSGWSNVTNVYSGPSVSSAPGSLDNKNNHVSSLSRQQKFENNTEIHTTTTHRSVVEIEHTITSTLTSSTGKSSSATGTSTFTKLSSNLAKLWLIIKPNNNTIHYLSSASYIAPYYLLPIPLITLLLLL